MSSYDYFLELQLDSFMLPDPASFSPDIISLKLVDTIPRGRHRARMDELSHPSPFSHLTPNPRIRRLNLYNFPFGFPEAFIKGLIHLIPLLTHIIVEHCLIAVSEGKSDRKRDENEVIIPHERFLPLLSFYAQPRDGADRLLQIVSFRDVEVNGNFWADAALACRTVPNIEVICTSGKTDKFGRVLDYPTYFLAPLIHPDLVTLVFALRGDESATPAQPHLWVVPGIVQTLTETLYPKLKVLDLTMLRLNTEHLENIVPMTPGVVHAKLTVYMPVPSSHSSAAATKTSDALVNAFRGWSALEELEILIPLSEELSHAVMNARKEDKHQTYLAVLPKPEQLEELSQLCTRLRIVEASIARQAFLGYVSWTRERYA